MGAIETVFTATIDDFAQKMAKLEQLNAKLLESNRSLAREVNKNNAEAQEGLSWGSLIERNAAAFKNLAVSLTGGGSILFAINKITQATEQWEQKMAGIGERTKKAMAEAVHVAVEAGDAAQADRIDKALAGAKAAKPAEARAIFSGISQAAPHLSLEQRLGLAMAASEAAPLVPEGGAKEFGALTGRLTQMMPGLTPTGASSLALRLRELSPRHVDELTGQRFNRAVRSMIAAGQPPEIAMAQAISAMEVGQQRPSALIKAAEMLDMPPEVKHGRLSTEDRLRNQFTQAAPPERLRMLRENKAISHAVLGEQALAFQQIQGAEVGRLASELKGAAGGNLVAQRIAELGGTAIGAEMLGGRAGERQAIMAEAGLGPRARIDDRARKVLDEIMLARGATGEFMESVKGTLGLGVRQAFSRAEAAAPEGVSPWEQFAYMKDGTAHQRQLAGAGFSANELTKIGKSIESERAIQEQIRIAKEQADLLKGIRQALDRPTGSAIQGNLNAHAEPAQSNHGASGGW